MIQLLMTEVVDKFVRENFRRVQDCLRGEPLFRGNFHFFTDTIARPSSATFPYTREVQHNLGFLPMDVIQLSVSNGATVTWKYDEFTSTTVKYVVTGNCTVRAYLGRHKES